MYPRSLYVLTGIFLGDDAYKNNNYYIKVYANTLNPKPKPGDKIRYVIVKGKGNLINKMRDPSTLEEIDEEYYQRRKIITSA